MLLLVHLPQTLILLQILPFFFFPPHGALVSYNWTNFKLQHERILNSTELNENFQNSPKLFRKIEKQQDQMREETT